MTSPKQKLTCTALSNATANRLGQRPVQKHLVPNEILAFGDVTQIQLLQQYLGIHADAHGGDLERLLQHRIPKEEVAVEAESAIGTLGDPIVVIGSAPVVTERSVLLHAADPDEEYGLVLLAEDVLALLRRGVGMILDHIVAGGEGELLGKDRFDAVLLADGLFGVVERLVDGLDGLFEIFDIAVLLTDVLLPIELVDVEGVGEVDVVVASKTAEVGDDALPGLDFVVVEGPSLPLGEGEGDLEMHAGEIAGFEGGGAFDSVEVVVEAGGAGDEEWGRDADEVDVFLEVGFEGVLAEEESFFELETVGEDWFVITVEAVLRGEASEGIVAVECTSHGRCFVVLNRGGGCGCGWF